MNASYFVKFQIQFKTDFIYDLEAPLTIKCSFPEHFNNLDYIILVSVFDKI